MSSDGGTMVILRFTATMMEKIQGKSPKMTNKSCESVKRIEGAAILQQGFKEIVVKTGKIFDLCSIQ